MPLRLFLEYLQVPKLLVLDSSVPPHSSVIKYEGLGCGAALFPPHYKSLSLYEGNNPTRDKRYFRVSADTMFLGEFIMFLRGSQD